MENAGYKQKKLNRLEKKLLDLKGNKQKALTVYLMGGDPDIMISERIIKAALENGADIIEIGVPFSDPLADGPVIQRAGIRSMEAGTNIEDIFSLSFNIRIESESPLALMLYYNTIFRYGIEKFIRKASESGIDALIIPDLPLEEKREIAGFALDENIIIIDFITPTTPEDRIEKLTKDSRGFIYCVSVSGVTGERKELASGLKKMIEKARRYTETPLFAGFGISTPGQAKEAASAADGVIVGSALIKELEENLARVEELPGLIALKVTAMKDAVRESE